MMTLEQVQSALHDKNTNIEHVARTTGLSRMTVVRMKRGDGNVLYRSWKLVSDYFEDESDAEVRDVRGG